MASIFSNLFGSPKIETTFDPAQALFGYKATALNIARSNAEAAGTMPTLDDYHQAFLGMKDQMEAEGIPCNSKIAADLSGQEINGFLLSEPQTERATTDFFNQDSDGAISDFHSEVNLTGASLKNCFVDPATSFNEELATSKSMKDVVFNNLTDGNEFRLGNGGKSATSFEGIHITNSHGGSITIDGATVNDMTISGNHIAELNLENGASIHGLTASAGIVELNGGPGTRISNSDFTNTTISMSGKTAGMSFTNASFTNTNMNGMDLRGATLTNIFVNGDLITSPEQLTELDVIVDDKTTISAIAANAPDSILSQPEQVMAASAPSPFAGLNLAGLNLSTPLVSGGDVTMNDVTAAIVPTTKELIAQKAEQAPVDRNYYAQMSESGGNQLG